MEPQFTQAISSRMVCDYLYFYYWFAVAIAILASGSFVFSLTMMKGPLLLKILAGLPYIFVIALGVLNALSWYVICERGLKPEQASNTGGRSAEGFRRR